MKRPAVKRPPAVEAFTLDDLIPVHPDAVALLPVPKAPTAATVRNWVKKGIGGVKLRAIKIGSRYYTRKEWLGEFIEALNK